MLEEWAWGRCLVSIDMIQLLMTDDSIASHSALQCSATMTFIINGVDIGHCVTTHICGETDAQAHSQLQ